LLVLRLDWTKLSFCSVYTKRVLGKLTVCRWFQHENEKSQKEVKIQSSRMGVDQGMSYVHRNR
jgi:hypothetical protein